MATENPVLEIASPQAARAPAWLIDLGLTWDDTPAVGVPDDDESRRHEDFA